MKEHLVQSDFHRSFITIEKSKYYRSPIQMGYMIFHHRMEKEIQTMNRQHSKGIALENVNENYPEVRTEDLNIFHVCFV